MELRHAAKCDAESGRQKTLDCHHRFAPELLRAAMAYSPDPMLAQDSVQETFLRFFIASMQGEPIVDERAWLHRVLRNLSVDAFRSARAHREVALEDLPKEESNPVGGIPQWGWRGVAQRVLAPREWECVRLRADGCDYREIAAALHIRTGTVAALLNRATGKLRATFLRRERLA